MNEVANEEMRDKLGNLERVRELLFGEQSRNYEDRFKELETEVANLRRDTLTQLSELKTLFANEISAVVDSIEKKLKYLSVTADEEFDRIRQTVDNNFQISSATLTVVEKNVKTQTSSLQEQVSQLRNHFEQELVDLRNYLLKDLESRYAHLLNTKLSREDLAEILFELCMRVKNTEVVTSKAEIPEPTRKREGELLLMQQYSEEREKKRY